MKIGILGTGMVGQALASKLASLGHQVMMGSRTANNEKALAWQASAGNLAQVGTFADAAEFAEMVFNCTQGAISLEVLQSIGESRLAGKILVDVANPLDFSKGMPPPLTICNDDSLGELIQRNFPSVKVVKTLNTINCSLMVNPSALDSEHDLFISGNDQQAKATVRELLESFGWKTMHDLGDISTARGTEQILPIWIRLWGAIGHPQFNFRIVIGQPAA